MKPQKDGEKFQNKNKTKNLTKSFQSSQFSGEEAAKNFYNYHDRSISSTTVH